MKTILALLVSCVACLGQFAPIPPLLSAGTTWQGAVPSSGSSYTVLYADAMVDPDLSSTAKGTAITASVGTNCFAGDVDYGFSYYSGSSAGTMTNFWFYTNSSPNAPAIFVGGTSYNYIAGTNGWFETNGNIQSLYVGNPAGPSKLTVGGMMGYAWPVPTHVFTLAGIHGGSDYIHLNIDNDGAGHLYGRAETLAGTGANFNLPQASTNLWVTIMWDAVNGNGVVWVYSTNGTLIGMSTNTIATSGVGSLTIGENDNHGASAGSAWMFGPWLVDWTYANFPLGPACNTNAWAPIISGVGSSGVSGTGAGISWTTDHGSSSCVLYGTTTAYGSSSSSTAMVKSHSISLSGLSTSTTYHYQVLSSNTIAAAAGTSIGLSSASGDNTFTTTSGALTVSQIGTNGSGYIGSGGTFKCYSTNTWPTGGGVVLIANNSASGFSFSAIDSRNNTYTVATNVVYSGAGSGYMLYAPVTTALQSGDTITITTAGGAGDFWGSAFYVSQMKSSGAKDVCNTNVSAYANSITVTTASIAGGQNEAAFAAGFMPSTTTASLDGSYTVLETIKDTTYGSFVIGWRQVTTGTVAATISDSPENELCGMIGVFKSQ